jgi:sterol desaturase/sphingolipid hydroxylase (fatty acid hydroxylase superfamily)
MQPQDIASWHPLAVALGGVAYFAAIYLAAGLIAGAVRGMLLRRGRARLLDPRPVPTGQVVREWRQSAVSIVIFGVGLLVPWLMVVHGWATVQATSPPARVLLELLALLVWNDVHFYAVHRTLHQPKLLRAVHMAHHRSVVTTPWSTYAFHPVEALLLGSVAIPPMLVWSFTPVALALLPILSLTYNVIGHANFRALPKRWRWLSNAHDHHLHHACHRGNYGFLFTFMDRGLGTQLPHDAAQAVIEAGLARQAREAREAAQAAVR